MIIRIFITSFFIVGAYTPIKGMQEAKFSLLCASPEMRDAHNIAASYAFKHGKEHIDNIAIIAQEHMVDPKSVVSVSNIQQPLARRYYFDSKNNRSYFTALDERYTANLTSGETIHCNYTQLSPSSGYISALMELELYPIPLPIENFFILRNVYLQNSQSK